MSLKRIYLIGALMLVTIISCTKDKVTAYPVAGLYTGTYSVSGQAQQPPLFYSFIVYPDGKMTTKGKGDDGSYLYSEGTWTLTGSTFNATISSLTKYNGVSITQSITASFSNDGKLSNGTWQDLNNPYTKNQGTYSTMQRVN